MYGIAFKEGDLRPTGGPAGYLYNLRHGLGAIGCNEVSFLPGASSFVVPGGLKKRIPLRVRQLNRARFWWDQVKSSSTLPDDFFGMDSIHFHSTVDLYRARKWLSSYSGRVILTSHSPCVAHKEVLDILNKADLRLFGRLVSELKTADSFAFSRADGIIFPCVEAEECYFNTWDDYRFVRDESKIHYLPTGIKAVFAAKSRKSVRQKYGIPPDAFVVSFAGRHNEIKGYDRIKKLAESGGFGKEVWFMIAGNEGPLMGPRASQWIEVGWTDDPHSIISASDVFILPNRETYFDLVLLEVLCLGVPVIASLTGGNKHFMKYEAGRRAGMAFFYDDDELRERVNEARSRSAEGNAALGRLNTKLYEEEFSSEVFASRYVSLLESIG